MKLSEAKKLYGALRLNPSRIHVARHAFVDHPERSFSEKEIKDLVSRGGRLTDNRDSVEASLDSFLLFRNDLLDRPCKFVLIFGRNEKDQLILVISAYRRTKK